MLYLIDGHNLIPALGLRLEAADDELELVSVLQEFSRMSRQKVEVYFDGAPPGRAGTRRLGNVVAHFVSERTTADAAIRARLNAAGKSAGNWTVVSSDREVQSDARAARASVITSHQFALALRSQKMRRERSRTVGSRAAGKILSPKEVEAWLEEFRRRS